MPTEPPNDSLLEDLAVEPGIIPKISLLSRCLFSLLATKSDLRQHVIKALLFSQSKGPTTQEQPTKGDL